MSAATQGAQRASRRKTLGPLFIGVLAALIGIGGLVTDAHPAEASSKKVVIVVGATGSATSGFRNLGRKLARRARSYGAYVVTIFSPYATWSRVLSASRGADLLIYLGHGNGWPSPYAPFQERTKDGLGLNATYGRSDYNTEYYGASFVRSKLNLGRNAVVLLIHLCYASGNPEWGGWAPTLHVAKQRVDNYAAGFLRTGARAVIADGLGNGMYVINGLFRGNKTLRQIFWRSPRAVRTHSVSFNPGRSPYFARALMDPDYHYRGRYYRSIVGKLDMHASTWRRS